MTSFRPRLVAVAAASVALATTAAVTPAVAAAGPDKPILTSWSNPGVAKDGARYVMFHTVSWNAKGAVATATKPDGPWTIHRRALLTGTPAWAKNPNPAEQNRSVWAPSAIKGTNGTWVVFYAGLVRGGGSSRCIGTGTSTDPLGPYKPDPRPIACVAGSGTKPQDVVPNEHPTSLIDPTPAVVNGQTVLTYKTSHARSTAPQWHTTIRLLKLSAATPNKAVANPVHANGASIQLTTSTNKYIEENPSLVYRGGRYTLFTSFGFYGTRDQYGTRWRQNTRLWTSWTAKSPHHLAFPANSHTYGQGNAQVLLGLSGKWTIFWNGQRPDSHRGDGPKYLYAGIVSWSKGLPRVSSVYR